MTANSHALYAHNAMIKRTTKERENQQLESDDSYQYVPISMQKISTRRVSQDCPRVLTIEQPLNPRYGAGFAKTEVRLQNLQ